MTPEEIKNCSITLLELAESARRDINEGSVVSKKITQEIIEKLKDVIQQEFLITHKQGKDLQELLNKLLKAIKTDDKDTVFSIYANFQKTTLMSMPKQLIDIMETIEIERIIEYVENGKVSSIITDYKYMTPSQKKKLPSKIVKIIRDFNKK